MEDVSHQAECPEEHAEFDSAACFVGVAIALPVEAGGWSMPSQPGSDGKSVGDLETQSQQPYQGMNWGHRRCNDRAKDCPVKVVDCLHLVRFLIKQKRCSFED